MVRIETADRHDALRFEVQALVDHFAFTPRSPMPIHQSPRAKPQHLREISFGNRKTRAGQPWSIAYGSFVPFTTIEAAHAHAAEPEGRCLEITVSKLTFFHFHQNAAALALQMGHTSQ